MSDVIERAEKAIEVANSQVGIGAVWTDIVEELVNELKITRDLSDGEYARGAASVEDRYTDANSELSLDVEELLAVATIYLDTFGESEMMTLPAKARLQKIEEIVQRRGKRYY